MKWMTMLEKNTMNNVLACLDCNRRKWPISAELFLEGYEAINVSLYDEQSEFIAIKTRPKRRFYNKWIKW